MMESDGPGSEAGAPSTTPIAIRNSTVTSSQQVAWWPVHTLVAPVLNQVSAWPLLGTPAWCSLAADDPAKWAAVLDGGQHWALHVDICQLQRCQASKDIAGAADWKALASAIRGRRSVYIPRMGVE